jgi:hypothetical protein
MGKKNFISGLDQLLTPSADNISNVSIVETRKLSENRIEKKATIRATFIVNTETIEKIRALGFYQRKDLKDILEEAFILYISKFGEDELLQALNLYNQKV